MHFRAIEETRISDNGAVVAFAAVPDRGDSEVIVVTTDGSAEHRIPRARAPQITPDGRFVAARIEPSFAEKERTNERKDRPKSGLAILDVKSGEHIAIQDVSRFELSHDGRWIAILLHETADTTGADTTATSGSSDWKGGPLLLRDLHTGSEHRLNGVDRFAWASRTSRIAYYVSADSASAALRLVDLVADAPRHSVIHAAAGFEYDRLTWSAEDAAAERLAFLARPKPEDKDEDAPAETFLWESGSLLQPDLASALPEGWVIPLSGSLSFSRDAERLFVGARPHHAADETESDTTDAALFDVDSILEDRTVDVWHVDDPRIVTQQKQAWNRERSATHPIVYHIADARAVRIGGPDRQVSRLPDNDRFALASDATPYYPYQTWEGFYSDVYAIDLQSGDEMLVAERLSGRAYLAPDGRHAVYYEDAAWHAVNLETGVRRNLTAPIAAPFANEDHDYPQPPPGYGIGGWVGSNAVLINDKFDVWQVPLNGSEPVRLTDGRPQNRIFRVIEQDRDQEYFEPGEALLLSSYHDRDKNFGFYRARVGSPGVERLLEEERRFDFVAKAKDADALLFTRERFDEFPDLWMADAGFRQTRRLTDVNPQMDEFLWGSAELIEWRSVDGVPLQGVVIKPENYDASRRYPVIVYYYRFFSQRLHEFNRPQINHRPAFPFYTGDDYVIFLPDIVFEVGRPGLSATKSLVPGVQKLIDVGIADPDRIGLHGHSWSGYQTAFVVTQTDIFRTAIAGAPVSNMTSAYSGIRWGSGMARQFQYEMTQSRLGASMWDARDRYIENSPVFYADRINTPLLIIHGDDDGAVPWYQSIEMYLAMRRLGKEAVFLQYRGEDHHPAAYPNKLDWAMRMKEWFDHYLKDEPAAWIEEGEPYAGR